MENNSIRSNKSTRTWNHLVSSFTKIRSKELIYLQKHGLTMNQYQVLNVLYHKGNQNISSITKIIMSTPGNITIVIKNLKRDKLITSIQDKSDKRASVLSITNSGKNILEGLFNDHEVELAQSFEVMNDAELDTLFSLLRKLQTAQ